MINVYGAHGKSIIAALGIKLPNVQFLPEDADVTEDINTAKAHGKIAEIIKRHNDAPMLFLKTLFLLYNQGVVAAYIYNRASKNMAVFKFLSMLMIKLM